MAHPTVYNQVATLAKFRQPSTLKDAGVSTYLAKRQLAEGLIEKVGKVETGQRGRPAALFALTQAGLAALNPVTPVQTDEPLDEAIEVTEAVPVAA
jgi:predicted ArsR family transcriptional regulator